MFYGILVFWMVPFDSMYDSNTIEYNTSIDLRLK
jgi:hypothetical protein